MKETCGYWPVGMLAAKKEGNGDKVVEHWLAGQRHDGSMSVQSERSEAAGAGWRGGVSDIPWSHGESWPTAAVPMWNPYCSCKLTRVRSVGDSQVGDWSLDSSALGGGHGSVSQSRLDLTEASARCHPLAHQRRASSRQG